MASPCPGPSVVRAGTRLARNYTAAPRRASRLGSTVVESAITPSTRRGISTALRATGRRQQAFSIAETPTRSSDLVRDEPALHIAPLAGADPALFKAVRPQPRSAYTALAYRLKLISAATPEDVKKARIDKLVQACTHPSYAQLIARIRERYGEEAAAAGLGRGIIRAAGEDASIDGQYIVIDPSRHNAVLATLGNTLMGLTATESLHLRYPNLPNRILKAAVSAYVGPTTLSDIAAELGISAQGIVRWDRAAQKPSSKRWQGDGKLTSQDVHADVMRAITALMLQEQGLAAARDFVHTQMLSRLIPLLSLLKFNDPKRALVELCRKTGTERPQSRMIAETGRLSINPIFVVGVWSGEQKLGEGTGSAIRMAEYRAAEDALRRFYMSETPGKDISLPSTTLDPDFAPASADTTTAAFKDIWHVGEEQRRGAAPFKPAPLGKSEIIFGSKA